MEKLSTNSTTQLNTYTQSTKHELDFSAWKSMSLKEKRLSVVQASASNDLGNRLKNLDSRIITMTNKHVGDLTSNSLSSDAAISLLNEINLVRDEQYALKLQLEYLGCQFNNTDTLTQVNAHLAKQLMAADQALMPAIGKNKEDPVAKPQNRLITTLLSGIKLKLTQDTHTQANSMDKSLSEKIHLTDHRTTKESADNALTKKRTKRTKRAKWAKWAKRARSLSIRMTKSPKRLHLGNDTARDERARHGNERDKSEHKETAV